MTTSKVTSPEVYETSHIRRQRSTKAEVDARRDTLLEIVSEQQPMTVRQAGPELGFSEAVERVLLKGMSRDVDARYATAPEFATAFAQAAGGKWNDGGMLGRLFNR